MRRSTSAPLLLAALLTTGELDGVPGRRPTTLPTDDAAGNAWADAFLYRMWLQMVGRTLYVFPELVVQVWESKIYVMLYLFGDPMAPPLTPDGLHPDQQIPEALQAEQWHATLAVAYTEERIQWRSASLLTLVRAWRLATRIEAHVRPRANAMVLAMGLPTTLTLDLPPYPRSWTLGLQHDESELISLLMTVSERIISSIPGVAVRLRARRAVHISWL